MKVNPQTGNGTNASADKKKIFAEACAGILREELIPSLGCTEPSSIAFVTAKARETLGCLPDRCVVEVSGNILKNTKSVMVPNTGGMKGIRAAAAAGIIAGRPDLDLEILRDITSADIDRITDYLEQHKIDVVHRDNGELLYIAATLYGGGDCARVTLKGGHLNISAIERNGRVIFSNPETAEADTDGQRSLLTIADIVDFAKNADIGELKPIIKRQIEYNYAISREGLNNDWGANVGSSIRNTFDDHVMFRAVAAAAAGSDARMSGCDLPVVIISGSGNQGITASVPVVEYAREFNCSEEMLYRSVILSDLVTVHQKTSIGKLSAFCGAVSAGCGAAAGIAFLMGGDYDIIAHTIVNTLAIISGMVCDGAKPSCAGKIATAVQTGILGYSMYANDNMQFYGGDGIVRRGVDNTIANVGRVASRGMRETDREIIRIMQEDFAN
jgi:L-cysteine desulfidase